MLTVIDNMLTCSLATSLLLLLVMQLRMKLWVMGTELSRTSLQSLSRHVSGQKLRSQSRHISHIILFPDVVLNHLKSLNLLKKIMSNKKELKLIVKMG